MHLALVAVGLCVLAVGVVKAVRARRAARDGDIGHGRRVVSMALMLLMVTGMSMLGPTASAQAFDCKAPPEPERPGDSFAGAIDPPAPGRGAPGSVYGDFGYSGLTWHTYDLGCPPANIKNTGADIDTMVGGAIFGVAKAIVAAVNALHYYIAQGAQLLAPLDRVIQDTARSAYDGIFVAFISLALLISAVIVLWLSQSGKVAPIARHLALGVVALAAAAAAGSAPDLLYKPLDNVVLEGTNQIQQGFVQARGAGDVNTLPTTLTERILVDNWKRGEFGSPDAPQARDLSGDLLRAQAFSNQEVTAQQDGQEQVDAKKQAFSEVADRMGDRYTQFQGLNQNRAGAGLLALLQAVAIGVFQLAAKLVLLTVMLTLRLLIVLLPVVAVIGVVKPDILLGTLRVGGMALVNALIVATLTGLHTLMTIALLNPANGIPAPLAIFLMLVISILLWAVMRPFKRMFSLGREFGRHTAIGEGGGGFLGPVLGVVANQFLTSRAARQGAETGARDPSWWLRGDGRARPEGATPPPPPQPGTVYAQSQRVRAPAGAVAAGAAGAVRAGSTVGGLPSGSGSGGGTGPGPGAPGAGPGAGGSGGPPGSGGRSGAPGANGLPGSSGRSNAPGGGGPNGLPGSGGRGGAPGGGPPGGPGAGAPGGRAGAGPGREGGPRRPGPPTGASGAPGPGPGPGPSQGFGAPGSGRPAPGQPGPGGSAPGGSAPGAGRPGPSTSRGRGWIPRWMRNDDSGPGNSSSGDSGSAAGGARQNPGDPRAHGRSTRGSSERASRPDPSEPVIYEAGDQRGRQDLNAADVVRDADGNHVHKIWTPEGDDGPGQGSTGGSRDDTSRGES